jgi:hypothetical protein
MQTKAPPGRAPETDIRVFGTVETSFTSTRQYMQYVKRKDAETLLPIIQEVCLPDNITHADGRTAYSHDTILVFVLALTRCIHRLFSINLVFLETFFFFVLS